MNIIVNEECLTVEAGTTLVMVKKRFHPRADLIILNGSPVDETHSIQEGDRLVFIQKGITPPRDELEGLMVARHSPEVFGRMKASSVGIAGVGGLGSTVAIALARMGVGRLVLVDGDVVEPSNLNRQQYYVDQIGLHKVDALRDTLGRVNPYCAVTTHPVYLDPENIPVIFQDVRIIVEALDRYEAKTMLIDTVMKNMPAMDLIAASGVAGYNPGNTIRTRKIAERLYMIGDLATELAEGIGLMAPRVGIAAHHQANAVVRLIMGEDPEQ